MRDATHLRCLSSVELFMNRKVGAVEMQECTTDAAESIRFSLQLADGIQFVAKWAFG